jgi:hypothetical protein
MADDNDDDDDDDAKAVSKTKGKDKKGKKSPSKKSKNAKSGDEDEDGKGADWEAWGLLYDMEDRVNAKVRVAIRTAFLSMPYSSIARHLFCFFRAKGRHRICVEMNPCSCAPTDACMVDCMTPRRVHSTESRRLCEMLRKRCAFHGFFCD